jgi:parvulin-like peptidyl-prolyl isomerase
MLPSEMPLSSRSEVAGLFGNEFAAEVLKLKPGRWSGPIESAYGLHLVFASEEVQGRLPSLTQIRPLVEEDVLSERRDREINAMYDHLLERYHVTVKADANAVAAHSSSQPAGKTITAPKDID